MQWRRPSARGLGSIVGAVILAVVLLAVIGFFIAVFRQVNTYTRAVMTLAEQRAAATLAAKSLVAWWRVDYPATGDLYINATNTYSQTIVVTGVTIVWSDGSYTILDQHNGTLANIGVTAEVKTASTTSTYTSFPIPVPPGASLILVLNGYAVGRSPATVSIALTAASQAAAAAARNYYLLYPNVTANVTVPAVAYLSANVTQLQHTALAGTNTWLGLANIPHALTRSGTVYQATVPLGTLQAGTAASLQTVDGNNLTATPQLLLALWENNTIYYDDFATNPFTAGRLVNSPYNTFNWTYDAASHAIVVSHPLTSYVLANTSGVYSANNTAISAAYVPGINLGSTRPFYSLVVGNVTETRAEATPSYRATGFYAYAYVYTLHYVNGRLGGLHYYSPASGYGYACKYFNINYTYFLNNQGSLTTQGPAYAFGPDIVYIYGVNETVLNSSLVNGVSFGRRYAIEGYIGLNGFKRSILYNRTGYINSTKIVNATLTSGTIGVEVYTIIRNMYTGGAAGALLGGTNNYARIDFLDNLTYTINYVVFSWANPRFVNITGLTPGYSVVLLNSTGGVVASAAVDAAGEAALNVTMEPVVRDATIEVYDSAGNLVLSYKPSEPVVGGNVYRAAYGVAVDSYVSVNTTGLLKPTLINVSYSFQASAPVNATIYIYDWVAGSFVPVKTMLNVYGSYGYVALTAGLQDYIASNGTILLRLYVYSANSFSLEVDELNANLTGLFQTSTPGYALFEAVGGSSLVDAYSVSLNPLSGNVSLYYVESIDAGTLFNGSAAISYDPRTGNLTLVNASGVYVAVPAPGAGWQLLVPGSECRATGPGARIIAYNTSTTTYLLVVPGEGNTTGCLISYTTPSSVAVQPLSLPAEPTAYTVDALDSSTGTAYLLLYDPTAAQAVIYPYSFASGTWGSPVPAPGVYSVGMAWNGSGLYVLYERGSLYYIDPVTGSSTYIPVQLPFYPFGAGDRLEYYSGWLLFVRADGTNELWEIYVR